jgi:hypothetical protein
LIKTAEWPFSAPALYLESGVNAVTGGGTLLVWAVGDTVSVIGKGDFTLLSTFRVTTSTVIQDILYDSTTSTLYLAAGYDSKASGGGLQIFSLADPSNPVMISALYKSTKFPGSPAATTPVADIDARGLGLYNATLFLADNNYGLRVIDVTDPGNPSEIPLTTPGADYQTGYAQPNINGEYTVTGGYVGVSVYPANDKVYAFVRDYYHGVAVFDVTNPGIIDEPVVKNTLSAFLFGSLSLLSDIFITETNGRLTAYVDGGNTDDTEFILSRLDVSFEGGLPIANYGYCVLPDSARGIHIAGSYAFVADGDKGLQIVDIAAVPSDTAEVLTYPIVGSYTTQAGFSYSVFLDGAALYLASGESGLNKLDVSDVTAPTFVARLESPLSADDICISGDYTYMLDRKKGLRIFDTTLPGYPVLRGFLAHPGPATDLCVSGNYAYISNSTGSINIVDISDPDAPFFTASSVSSPSPKAMSISGNYLYIADSLSGMRTVNITDPLNPVDLGSAATKGTACSVVVDSDRAYVSKGASGLEIFDVSNPEAPVSLVNVNLSDARAAAIYTTENSIFVFVANGASGLAIQDVTDLTTPLPDPVFFNQMDNTTTPSPFVAVSVAVLGSNAFVSLGSDGLLALDISTPSNPSIISHCLSSSTPSDVAAKSVYDSISDDYTTYVTVADGFTGFKILTVNNTESIDTTPLVPDLDSGCFIETSCDEREEGWLTVIVSFINHMFRRNPLGMSSTGEKR